MTDLTLIYNGFSQADISDPRKRMMAIMLLAEEMRYAHCSELIYGRSACTR